MDSRRVLISDVDGTLLGDDAALKQFVDWYASHRDELRLVYNSGRFFASIRESIASTLLPMPDAIIGGVGTEIRLCSDGELVESWSDRFDRWNASELRAVLADYPQLEPQPDEFQSEFKISYFARNLEDGFLDNLRQRLTKAGFRIELVYSSQRDLDVLPAGVDKGSASSYLAKYWNTPAQRVFVSGDSGNDLKMFQQGFLGIVVGNAHPELKSLNSQHVYQSSLPCAAGVLDGLRYWWNHTLADIEPADIKPAEADPTEAV